MIFMKGIFGFGKKKEESKQKEGDKAEERLQQPVAVSGGKWLVQYDRKVCIGSGTCAAVCEKHWVMEDDGKAKLIGSVFDEQTQVFEKMVDDSEFGCNKLAAEGCPPNCIHIINKETGEKII